MKTLQKKRQKKKPNGRFKNGFTLFEVTIAISLLAVVIFGFLMLMTQSLGQGQSSEKRLIAINEMRQIMETMRKQVNTSGLSVVTTGSPTWATNSLTGALNEGSNLATATIAPGSGDPLPVTITLSWTEKGKLSSYTVDTLVTKR